MQTMDMACGLAGLYDSIYTCSSVRWACWCVSHSFIVGRRRDNGAVQVHFGRDGGGGDGIETDGLDHKQDDDRVSAGQADFLEHKCANAVSAATVVYNSILTLTCNCICIANYPNNNDSHGVSGRMRTSRPVIVICANDGTVYTIDAACSRVAKDSQTQLPPGPVSVCCKDDAASEFTVVYQESICVMRLTAAVARSVCFVCVYMICTCALQFLRTCGEVRPTVATAVSYVRKCVCMCVCVCATPRLIALLAHVCGVYIAVFVPSVSNGCFWMASQ